MEENRHIQAIALDDRDNSGFLFTGHTVTEAMELAARYLYRAEGITSRRALRARIEALPVHVLDHTLRPHNNEGEYGND